MSNSVKIDSIEKAREFAENNWRRITMTQMRKFLAAVNMINNKIEASTERDEEVLFEKIIADITFLKVKLAYASGRDKEGKMRSLYEALNPAIENITTLSNYKNFAHNVEALIAYHKFYGGE